MKFEKKTILCSFGINLLILLLCIRFGSPKFGALDDYFMSKVLEGAFSNDYNVHMVFVNVVFGYALLPLYHLFPSVSWYYVGEVFAVFLSLSVVSFIGIKKLGMQWGPLFALIFVVCIAPDYYLSLQFTQCASILSAAGMLTLVYAVESHFENGTLKRSLIALPYFIGFILLFWGTMMRLDAFKMGLPFFVLALILKLDFLWKNKVKVVMCVVIALVGLNCLKMVDDLHYASPEYQTFRKFQPFRVAVGDGDYYDLNAAYDDLDEADISSEKLLRLRDWFLYDKDVFSLENLAPIIRVIGSNVSRDGYDDIVKFGLYDIASLVEKPIGVPWILVCLLLFWKNKQKSWYVWGSFVILGGLICYLMYISRNVYRVENGLVLYAAVLGIVFLKPIFVTLEKMSRISLVLFLLLCSVYVSLTAKNVRDPSTGKVIEETASSKNQDYKEIVHYIESAPDSVLFIASMQPFMGIGKNWYPHYKAASFGCWKKFISFGYWTPYYPDVENILREKGVDNPVKDAVHENVFVIGDDITDFLQDYHYKDKRIEKTVVDQFGEWTIDKYAVVEKDMPNE